MLSAWPRYRASSLSGVIARIPTDQPCMNFAHALGRTRVDNTDRGYVGSTRWVFLRVPFPYKDRSWPVRKVTLGIPAFAIAHDQDCSAAALMFPLHGHAHQTFSFLCSVSAVNLCPSNNELVHVLVHGRFL